MAAMQFRLEALSVSEKTTHNPDLTPQALGQFLGWDHVAS